jgi:hypothetical protein
MGATVANARSRERPVRRRPNRVVTLDLGEIACGVASVIREKRCEHEHEQ